MGSQRGWKRLKEAYQVARPDQYQQEQMHWYERQASKRNPKGLKGREAWIWYKAKVNRRPSKLR